MAAKGNQIAIPTRDLRDKIDADIEAFLKAGKKIQQIPTGVSGQENKPKKHIKLGKSKEK